MKRITIRIQPRKKRTKNRNKGHNTRFVGLTPPKKKENRTFNPTVFFSVILAGFVLFFAHLFATQINWVELLPIRTSGEVQSETPVHEKLESLHYLSDVVGFRRESQVLVDEADKMIKAWFESVGGKANKVRLKILPGTEGIGLFTTKFVKQGEIIFDLPSSMWLHSHYIVEELGSPIGRIFRNDVSLLFTEVESFLPLILHFIYHTIHPNYLLHTSDDYRLERERLDTLLSLLPRNYSLPLFWSDEELAQLNSPSVKDDVSRMNQNVEAAYNRLFPMLEDTYPSVFPTGRVTLQAFKWAWATVRQHGQVYPTTKGNTRRENTVVIMQPYACFINKTGAHGNTKEEMIDLGPGKQKRWIWKAKRDIVPDEQLFFKHKERRASQ